MDGILNRVALVLLAMAAFRLADAPITIHLAGDSTMAEKKAEKRPETGWGEALQQHFDATHVVVKNYARNGRSTRTFIEEGLWQQLIDAVHEGDYVFIEFGHNDESPTKTDRYTPPDQYRANLVRFVTEVRAKKATPVLMTPVSRRKFAKNGTVADSHKEYSPIVRAVAAELKVPFIDMDRRSGAVLARYGPDDSRTLFLQLKPGENANYPQGIEDNTHFNPVGAAAMAQLAVDGLRELNLPVVQYLRNEERGTRNEERVVSQAVTRDEHGEALLSPARLATLPAAQRVEWERYIARSDSMAKADSIALVVELQKSGKTQWTPAPADHGFFMPDSMTAQWFATDQAGKVASYILSYQAPNGGWSKRMGFTHVRAPGEAYTSEGNATWFSTIDNGATTEQLRFLGERIKAHDDAALRASFRRGLDYLFASQMPNGCCPQIYPLAGSYHDAITFNDDATINALKVIDAAAKGSYAFVPAATRTMASQSVLRGVDCILATQFVSKGHKTSWGAQHDPLTYQPVKARAYEHASLSGREGATIVNFLMQIDQPSPQVVEAVHNSAAWFMETAINGYSYKYKGDLTPQAGAGPLWARFYELNTNRPIFSDRDAIVKYNLSEIGTERRYGYMWYTDEPVTMLKRYEKWAMKHPM